MGMLAIGIEQDVASLYDQCAPEPAILVCPGEQSNVCRHVFEYPSLFIYNKFGILYHNFDVKEAMVGSVRKLSLPASFHIGDVRPRSCDKKGSIGV